MLRQSIITEHQQRMDENISYIYCKKVSYPSHDVVALGSAVSLGEG